MEAGAKLEDKIVALENERDSLTATLASGGGAEIVALQANIRELSEKLNQATVQISIRDATISARNSQIRQHVIAAGSAATTNQRLRDERDQLSNDLHRTKAELTEATSNIIEMRKQFAVHASTIASLEATSAALRQELDTIAASQTVNVRSNWNSSAYDDNHS